MTLRMLRGSGAVLSVLVGSRLIMVDAMAENTATEPGMPWPISTEEVDWHKILGAGPAPAEGSAEMSVTAPAIEWPVSQEPANWPTATAAPSEAPAAAEGAAAAEEASVTAPAIEWPVSQEPANWNTAVAAPADAPAAAEAPAAAAEAPAAAQEASVTAPAIEWPVSQGPANWGNAAPAAAASTAQSCQDSLRAAAKAGVILFKTGSASIAVDSMSTLEAIANTAKGCSGVKITVEGHTDSVGDPSRNKRLSERRANAIVTFLVNAGVPQGALDAIGYGQERPVAGNDSESNRALNRRIEFTVK